MSKNVKSEELVLNNRILFTVAVLICSVLPAFSADWYSVATGNWSATTSWSATSGGAPGAGYPVAGDNVIVEGGYVITVNVASVCANLTIVNGSALNVGGFNFTVNGTTTINGTISHTSITGTKIFTGLVTINAGGVWNNNTVNESITLRGGITKSGIFNAGTGIYTFNTNNQALTGTFIIPNVTITGITLTNGGTLTVGTALTGTGGLTQGINATLNIGGTSGIAALIALNTGNTVNFAGAAQSVNVNSYFNLSVSGSGNKIMTGNITVSGTLAITAGTFSVDAYTLTLNGPAITGTPSNLSTTSSSGLIFGGTSAGILVPSGAANLNNLTVNNPSGVVLSGNVTVSNTLTMTQGNISTGAFTLAISNGINTSLTHISGSVIGRLRRTVNTTPSVDYIFPVGTAASYRPAIMNFSSLSAQTNITAEFIATPPAGFTTYTDGIATLDNTYTEGYWRFSSSGLPAATYTLTLTGSGFISYPIDETTRITGKDNGNSIWRALGVHGSRTGNNISRSSVSNLNTTSFDFALATGCSIVSLGYGYERNITIDHTRVAGGSDLYNFPLLINLTGQTFLKTSPAGEIFNANGFDIIFTDNNYNKLDHQLEYYNGTTGDLIVWVRIPTLYSSSNTVIKVLYGNVQISANPSVTAVWDSHYKGVWHLDNSNLNDFTSFNAAGTSYNSPSYPSGKIYNALGMNGTNQYLEVLNNPNLNFAGNITVSAWVNMNTGARDQKIAGNQNNSSGGYKFGIYTNNKVEFEIRNAANTPSLNRDVAGGTVLNTGQWYYLAGVSSDVLDSIKTFVNGIPERPFKKTGILGTASDNLTVGKEPFLADYFFSGMFDEIRISDAVRSNGWMQTEYNNQSSPSTFYSVAAVAEPSNNLPSEGICTGLIALTFGYPAGGEYSGNPYIAGNVFTPPSAGTYPITYTYNGGCSPTSITKSFIMTDIPPAPVASNKEYCINQITYLETESGMNIRWYDGGTLVSTANPYSTGETASGIYNYTVTQTVNGCQSPATTVTLTIFNGITINTQPQPASACLGGNVTFTIAAAGINLTYQWQEDGVTISNGGIYSGATTSALTLTNPGIVKSGKLYRCVVSSSCGTSPLNSNTALLTVNPLPVAAFSYTPEAYCPNAANPLPAFSGGGVAGIFSSVSGLIFVSTTTGQVNLAASIPGSYTVTNTIPASGGCGVVTDTAQIIIISDFIWTGAVSTDWNVTGNWSCGLIPDLTTSVQVPDVANKPALGAGAMGFVRNIVVENAASLTISDNTIQIAGSITVNGIINSTDGSIEMIGPAAQSIDAEIFSGNTIKDLIINNPSGVTLQGPLNITGTVTIQNGDLASDGFLTLISSAAQTALIDGSGNGSISGDVTMQRYLASGFGYKYVSSPMQVTTVSEFTDDMPPLTSAFYRYDENRTTSGWVGYNNPANHLNPMEGYAVNFGSSSGAVNVDVTGSVNNGSLSTTLYNHNNIYTKGFNLIGNPYPSPIDWDASSGWTKTGIDNTLYYFRASSTDQYGGTYSTYSGGVSSDTLASNIIPSMQGFFVHVSDGTWPVTAQLAMTNSVRVTNLSQKYIKGLRTVSLLRFKASFLHNLGTPDYSVIYFDPKATNNFDGQLDAFKLMNTDRSVPNVYILTPDNTKISIKSLPDASEKIYIVPLGLKLNQAGDVIFRLCDITGSFETMRISLTDNLTGTDQDLVNNQEYKISLSAGEYENRFFLNLSELETAIDHDWRDDDLFSIYCSQGILKAEINSIPGEEVTLSIFNLIGQTLFIGRVYQPGHHEFDPGLKNGFYIVSCSTGTKKSSKKIIFHNQ